jgi:hypothetical protein
MTTAATGDTISLLLSERTGNMMFTLLSEQQGKHY